MVQIHQRDREEAVFHQQRAGQGLLYLHILSSPNQQGFIFRFEQVSLYKMVMHLCAISDY
jgi:hypothetical protein